MKYFILGFKKWNDINGRSNLKEFWFFQLFCFLSFLVIYIIDDLIMGGTGEVLLESSGPIETIFSIILIIPSLTLNVRRLHDINKSGYNLLWCLTIIGILFVWIMFLLRGTDGDNRYGPPSIH